MGAAINPLGFGVKASRRELARAMPPAPATAAAAQGVPAYVVFHDATLAEMARECPDTLAALAKRRAAVQPKVAFYSASYSGVLERGLLIAKSLDAGVPEGEVVFAEEQTRGRGRHGCGNGEGLAGLACAGGGRAGLPGSLPAAVFERLHGDGRIAVGEADQHGARRPRARTGRAVHVSRAVGGNAPPLRLVVIFLTVTAIIVVLL